MRLPEIVAAGIYDSEIVAKNVAVSKNRKTSMFEIELPLEDGGISYLGGGAKQIRTGMVICAKPGQIRHTKFPFRCYYLHMIIHDGPLWDILTATPDFFETGRDAVYREIFAELVRHYSALSDSEELMLQSLVLKLIYTIGRDASAKFGGGSRSAHSPTVEHAVSFIREHLSEELRLETVAKAVSMSPVHFHNTFKKSVGKTLRDYIEEQRIKKAIGLLLTTDASLTQIAFECGFSSQSYFSYVFKRRMHSTPREYAKTIHARYEI